MKPERKKYKEMCGVMMIMPTLWALRTISEAVPIGNNNNNGRSSNSCTRSTSCWPDDADSGIIMKAKSQTEFSECLSSLIILNGFFQLSKSVLSDRCHILNKQLKLSVQWRNN